MAVQGKYVILFIFGTALVAATFAWTFQYLRGRRILELWGADNAGLIRVDAERIELLVLGGSDETTSDAADDANFPPWIEVDGEQLAVAAGRDITKARGIIHARQALIEDASFAWEQQRGDCRADWRYALRFHHGKRLATVLLDTNCQRARLLETGREAAIVPKIFKGWMTFVDEQLNDKSTSNGERGASAP